MDGIMRKLPIGIQTFEKLREGGYLYVDKTAFIWKIASTETPYCLSRPRRFGKSLLLSTFEAYFVYGVLKSSDRYLRFVFLTGVTKFAQVSVFSDLNQLNDISMDFAYATLCGITKEELGSTFVPELERQAVTNEMTSEAVVEMMTRRYDGYHFHPKGAGVFNPFSVLNSFSK